MHHLPRLIAAHGLSAFVAVSAFATNAAAQANCEMYAKLAIQQQQENETSGCAFAGKEWSADLKGHLDWCGGVAPDQWKAELQKRQQALAACAGDKSD